MSVENKKVAIIGAGNLGRRHLQSLALCKEKISIYIVDPSSVMLDLAVDTVSSSGISGNVSCYKDIEEICEDIDLAIVATTAKVRLKVLDYLVNKKAKNIILEKVAFNSIHDINQGVSLFRKWGGNAWVNCPRRDYDVYKKIKTIIGSRRLLNFRVRGQEYGLACNGIHFIDLAAFLLDCNSYDIYSSEIVEIVESKRDGYIEFFGALNGKFSSGCAFTLECDKSTDNTKYIIEIYFDGGMLLVDEMKGVFHLDAPDKVIVERFKIPYQSELTGPMADSILSGFGCALVDFESAMNIHYPFIEAAYNVFAKKYGSNEKRMVPIT